MLKIKGPGEYKTNVERHNKIVKMLTNFELYCPDIDSDSRSYRNVKKILDHATNAYDINKELCQQIEDSMNKISCLENKLKNAVNALKKEQQDCETRSILDMLISEIEEELKNCISNYLWFIPQKINDSSSTGVYCPKVGRDDFKGTFLTICFKIIFD